MTDPVAEKLPRKKRSILWWLGGLLLVILGAFLYQLLGPNPPIVVSRETTFITEPLRPDGLPDFERYVLEQSRSGVTPENNAAVLLWQALWPGELDVKHFAAMAAELGLEEIPSEDEALVSVVGRSNIDRVLAWFRKRDSADQDGSSENGEEESYSDPIEIDRIKDEVLDLMADTMSRPWTSSDLPPLADWVHENQRPLDLIVEASRRPRYYSPSPSALEGEGSVLIAWLLPGLQGTRDAARSLATRAMWHLGEGRLEESWQDLLAVHRLGRLVGQGQMVVEQLVGISIEGVASLGTRSLLHDASLSPELALQISRDLAGLKELQVADVIVAERLQFVDLIVRLRSEIGEPSLDDFFWERDEVLSRLRETSIDWNVPLRIGNQFFDRMAAAQRLPTRAQREQALKAIEVEAQQMGAKNSDPRTLVAAALSRTARSRIVGSFVIPWFMNASVVGHLESAEDRVNVTLALLRLAAALAVHRAVEGEYPETLAALAPGTIETLPADIYGQAFVYRPIEKGFILYSIGPNGLDDGGSNEEMQILEGRSLTQEPDGDTRMTQIPTGADDVSIRLPPPELQIPTVLVQPADDSQ